jgi:hypothetical protein
MDYCCPVNDERDEVYSVAVTVCRMDAAFEPTGMCLQRVLATEYNSCLGCTNGGISQAQQPFPSAMRKVNGTAVIIHSFY